MSKKLITICIFMAFVTYSCGNDVPVYYENTDTQSESTTEQLVQDYTDEIKLEVDSNSDKVSFKLADGSGLFKRYNGYTGEVSYSFEVESVKLDVTEFEITEPQYNINVSLTGKKTFDSKGDDAVRGLKYMVRILDSNGVVIDSSEKFNRGSLKVGDRIEDSELDVHFFSLDLKPGEYIIDIFQQPENYIQLASENTKYLNPERWYSRVVYMGGEDSEYEFDEQAQWIYEYSMRNIYIDDNLILYNVFNTPYDLNKIECEISKNENSFVVDDCYLDSYYYDIEDFETLLTGVPEEAMPHKIRVAYSPGGSIIDGERPTVMVTFIYRENDNDTKHGSIAFWSINGDNLTQKEWDMILSNAEKANVDVSQLAVISD